MSDQEKSEDLYLPLHCLVPLSVREDPTVPAEAKIYLGELNVLACKFGYCFASDEQLAKMKGVSIDTIKRWHKILEEGKHIYRDTNNIQVKTDDGKFHWRKKRRIYLTDSKNFTEGVKNNTSNEGVKNDPLEVDNRKEDNRQVEPARGCQTLKEKSEILKEAFPDLDQTKIMQLCKNHNLHEIEKAIAYAKTQEEIETPYKWISNCIRNKWWIGNEEEMTEVTLWDKLKAALKLLRERNGGRLALDLKKNYVCIEGRNAPLIEITPNHLKNEETIRIFTQAINDSFSLAKKIMYVKLPGKIDFEVEE